MFYVDLENTKASAVAYSLANVFGLPVNSEKELFAEFRQRQCAIVLDNCENLLNDPAFEKMLNQFQVFCFQKIFFFVCLALLFHYYTNIDLLSFF